MISSYIENLDPECILALTKTASDLQFIPIRDAIWKYLASTTSIRVTVPVSVVQMQFNIPSDFHQLPQSVH
jgi:hypothetical protein